MLTAADESPRGPARAEVALLRPWIQDQSAADEPMESSKLAIDDIIDLLSGLVDGSVPMDGVAKTVRLGRDDLQRWYLRAVRNQPGDADWRDLNRWFWADTAVARLLGSVAGVLATSDDPQTRGLAEQALVPREHRTLLLGDLQEPPPT